MTKEFSPVECLTALTSPAKKHKILVYDLESKDGDTQQPGFTRVFLAGLFDGTTFQSFRNDPRVDALPWEERALAEGGTVDTLMRAILTRKHRGKYVYAHNGGSFDHLHILPWLTRHIDEFSYTIIPLQSSIQVLKVTSRTTLHSWTFLDSLRLLPMSLDKAAKTFGFEGKLTHSLRKHENDDSWWTYLERDCTALYEAVSQCQHLILERLGGEMGITAPSTSMKLYRRRFMGHGAAPAMIPQHRHWKRCTDSNCQGCLHAWIRQGYHGGRVEVFRRKATRQSYYDINSSYPAAMREDMPAGELHTFGPNKGVRDFPKLHQKYIGFIECEVFIPEDCDLPPLPYADPISKKLLFPVGRFAGVWSYDELKLLQHPRVGGRITRVLKSAWYERKTCFFDFVKELYSYRDKSAMTYEEGLAMLAKLMMNSLYGKFGMNEDRREIIVLKPGEKPPVGAKLPAFANGEEDALARVFYVEKRVSPPYIIPQISAHITALARIRLWGFLMGCVELGGKPAYCDTDSLICDLPNLPTSNELGALKNEYPGELLSVEAVGPKMYLLSKRKAFVGEHKSSCRSKKNGKCKGCKNRKLAMKGIPKELRTVATLRTFQKGGKIRFRRLEKLGAMAERFFAYSPTMIRVEKSLLGGFSKRVEFRDGSTKPRVLSLQ